MYVQSHKRVSGVKSCLSALSLGTALITNHVYFVTKSRPAKGPHHEKFKGDRAFPFIILLDIGEVRSQILGHRESLDLVLTEDLRHLLVGSEVLLVLRVLC